MVETITQQEQSLKDSNLAVEDKINHEALNFKGGIPQRHHWAHKNSVDAFKKINPNTEHKRIYDLFLSMKHPMTDKEAMKHFGFTDPNKVRPRISELIDFGFLKEWGKIIDNESHCKVRACVVNKEKQTELAGIR